MQEQIIDKNGNNILDAPSGQGVEYGSIEEVEQNQTKGYQMINSLEIDNFRCYEHLELKGLKRVNVIVGANGSGKTAFLEAVFLVAGGNPSPSFHMRTWRGLGSKVSISGNPSDNKEFLLDLFHNFESNRKIHIAFKGDAAHTRELNVTNKQQEPMISFTAKSVNPSVKLPIVFEWKKNKKIVGRSEATISDGEFQMVGGIESIDAQIFASDGIYGTEISAQQFDVLAIERSTDELQKAICEVFPFIKSISSHHQNGQQMLFADIDSSKQLMPIGLISAGISKFCSILIAIATHKKGIVLLDEFDNGFYYKALPNIWQNILKFAELFECQIFASTHSLEALRSLIPALENHEDEFCLLQAHQTDGVSSILEIEGKYLEAALTGNVEVRG